MVKDFTQNESFAVQIDSNPKQITESQFEESLKHNVQSLLKTPRQEVLDIILTYSKSLREQL